MEDLKRILKLEDGVSSIEYALVALLVALAIILAATALGVNLGDLYRYIANRFPTILTG
jgi:pilus assembly protein Flp/PilA